MSDNLQATQGQISLREVDPDAIKVVRKLLAAGHEAYLVGGCVRDLYLGRKPKDFDVATSATPEQIRRLFRNSRIIGKRFRLAHVYFGPKIIETSTFRTAPALGTSEELLITADNEWGSEEDDARRRDFTVNGLFLDADSGKIVDFVDGLVDLDRNVIRTIGAPLVRFREDPVRMIRAIKFAARLGFDIEAETWDALLETVQDIVKCSRARVLEEIYKLLRGGAATRSFELLLQSKLLEWLMPHYVALYTDATDHGIARPDDTDLSSMSALFWRFLDALDAYTNDTRQTVGNGVLQALLFAPLVTGKLMTATPQALDRMIDELMTPACAALGVARRDRDLARQILMAHRRMTEVGPHRKRRLSLVQRQYFHDALIFLGLSVKAHGDGGGELRHWQALASTHALPTMHEAAGKPSRRRRGGRKRRGAGGLARERQPHRPASGES